MKKPDILASLKREAARKSNLDADKDTMERAATEIARLRAENEYLKSELGRVTEEQHYGNTTSYRYEPHDLR